MEARSLTLVFLWSTSACTRALPPEESIDSVGPIPTVTAPAALPPEPNVHLPPPEPTAPEFRGESRPLTGPERSRMTGVSWKTDCPVPLDDLVMLEIRHYDFESVPKEGQMVVHKDSAAVVIEAFEAAWDAGFAIERMQPVVEFEASDQKSMRANNTSAFNCRPITGGSSFSEHSYGRAIDINPAQNPYISASGRTILPAAAKAYVDREASRQGMLYADSAIVKSFTQNGWTWGGAWKRTRDYQHLSKSGR